VDIGPVVTAAAPTEHPRLGTVALAHDYLNQRGGAERVALELTRLFPGAPLYTSLYRPASTFDEFRTVDVRTSYLDRLPVDAGFRNLLPLYPSAFRELSPVAADIVVASSSGWAHGLRVKSPGKLVVYCHNPARWLYGEAYLGASSAKQNATLPLRAWLQRWDRLAAGRAAAYVANSEATRTRVQTVYGIDSAVVPPPVEVHRFTPTPQGERLLVVSRLLPYKRVDIVVEAATRAGLGLDVVGSGPAAADLRQRAGPTVRFHGSVDDTEVTELMQSCRALCLPGVEDFGITPVEAQAAGKPVIAFARGGALETVEPGVSGVLFSDPTADGFLAAVRECEGIQFDHRGIAARAARFSPEAFRDGMTRVLEPLLGLSG
jgi:glycosyltransferase involved in cell wall biosynthesis